MRRNSWCEPNPPQCWCCWLQVLLSLDFDDDWADNPVVCRSWALSWDFKEAFDEAFDVRPRC